MFLFKESIRSGVEGVTLLELLVVLVILSILLTVSVPSLKSAYNRSELTGASRSIVALMRIARAEAIFREHAVEMRFDLATDRYRLDLMEGSEEERGRNKELLLSEVEKIRYLPREISILELSTEAEEMDVKTVGRIVFYPNGSATGATIYLGDMRGRVMKIEVAHATALAEAEYYKPGSKAKQYEEGEAGFGSSEYGELEYAERKRY